MKKEGLRSIVLTESRKSKHPIPCLTAAFEFNQSRVQEMRRKKGGSVTLGLVRFGVEIKESRPSLALAPALLIAESSQCAVSAFFVLVGIEKRISSGSQPG